MTDYTISQTANKEIYRLQINKLKREKPNFMSEEHLNDVDGSAVSIFTYAEGEVKIFFDTEVGAVYVKASMPIDNFLVNKPYRVERMPNA